MNDLTEARPTTGTVTAEELVNLGYWRGRDDERADTLRLLNNHLMLTDGETADTIWTLAKIIDAKHHRSGA